MNGSTPKTFGAYIRQRRRELRLTQERVANAIGVTTRQVINLEQDYDTPNVKTLFGLADVLDVDGQEMVSLLRKRLGMVTK